MVDGSAAAVLGFLLMFLRRFSIAAAATFVLVQACAQPSTPQPTRDYSDFDAVAAALRSENIEEILKALNEVKRVSYKGEMLPFIEDLWFQRSNEHPDLPWPTISRDVVRIELADILVQAHRNGLLESLDDNVHKYARELAAGDDVQLIASAAQVLSVIDDADDVPVLESIARDQQMGTFRATIAALAQMCNPAAPLALDRLESAVTEGRNREFLVETRRSMDEFKRKSESCEAR